MSHERKNPDRYWISSIYQGFSIFDSLEVLEVLEGIRIDEKEVKIQ